MNLTEEQKRQYRKMIARQTVPNKDGPGGVLHMRAPAPDQCQACGLSNEKIGKKFGGWTAVQMANGVTFYICPRCHSVSANPNARDNICMVQVLQEDDKQRREEFLSSIAEGEKVCPSKEPPLDS